MKTRQASAKASVVFHRFAGPVEDEEVGVRVSLTNNRMAEA
jgi:hypothetical protein